MKAATKINPLFGAVLSLLITFGLTHSAGASERIVFDAPVTVKTKNFTTTTSQVFSMDPAGTDVRQLTTSSAGAACPKWSPDGQHIAFIRGGYVYAMDSIGEANGGLTFAVGGPVKSTGLDWSPDGSTIWFTGYPTELDPGVWAVSVNAATGQVGVPVLVRSGFCHWPASSPDGTKLAFADDPNVTTVMVLKIRDLVTGAEITCNMVPSAQASWSPTGDRIAFVGLVKVTTTSRGGKQTTNTYQEIFIANADLTGITQVTDLKGVSAGPTWNAEGTELCFSSRTTTGEYSIYKMPLDTGVVTFLHSGKSADWTP